MINRDLYKKYFTQDSIPNWVCPTCQIAVLNTTSEHFIFEDTAITKQSWNEDWFDPDMARYTYTALFTCSNPSCKEAVASSGFGSLEEEYIHTPSGYEREYVSYFRPLFFHPPLKFFQIPNDTPDNVKKAIEASFSLSFSNKSAAVNQIRIALECLLNNLGIPQVSNENIKSKRLSLHDRVELLTHKYPKLKDICLAIKWLGNSGSHCEEEMTMDNVLDGYEMMSFVLDELYDNKHERIAILAKQINDKKGAK